MATPPAPPAPVKGLTRNHTVQPTIARTYLEALIADGMRPSLLTELRAQGRVDEDR